MLACFNICRISSLLMNFLVRPLDITIDLQYLPSIRYFQILIQANHVYLNDTERFRKQTYRNRAHISGANGMQQLIIPVKKGKNYLTTSQVEIDNTLPWRRHHLRSIESTYGKSPFFDHYFDPLQVLFQEASDTMLFEWNLRCLKLILSFFKSISLLDKIRLFSEKTEYPESEDLSGFLLPKHPDIPLPDHWISKEIKYYQPFEEKQGFLSDLSILDLLFSTGPQAIHLLS